MGLGHHLDLPLERKLAAIAQATGRDVDELIEEAVRYYLDQQADAQAPRAGFKQALRSWSLEDIDLERINGQDRAAPEFD
jgi:hypothetical protein